MTKPLRIVLVATAVALVAADARLIQRRGLDALTIEMDFIRKIGKRQPDR